MVTVEELVEWRLTGEIEVLGENLPQRQFVHLKSHMTRPGFEPGPSRWEVSKELYLRGYTVMQSGKSQPKYRTNL
jgi:hypothetical protein